MTQTATKTRKPIEITSPVVYRINDKQGQCLGYLVPSDQEGVDPYKVTFNYEAHRYECNCKCGIESNHTVTCKHIRAVNSTVAARKEFHKQEITSPAPQFFEEGQEVLYSYCPGLVFTGIIAGKRTRLNGEDGYMLQTKFWTEVVPVRFLTSKATQQVEIEQQQETPAATPELVETHRVSRVDGIVTRWYPEYRQGTEWFRYPQPDGNRAVSFVIEGRAETWLSERLAAVAEVKAERKMAAFKAGPDYDTLAVTKTTAAEREAKQREAEETAASYMRHFYDEY